jgi:hypothetical protein
VVCWTGDGNLFSSRHANPPDGGGIGMRWSLPGSVLKIFGRRIFPDGRAVAWPSIMDMDRQNLINNADGGA